MNETQPVIDPLDQSSDDIDISYPVVAGSDYKMSVKEAKTEPNKDGDGTNLVTIWQNEDELTSTKGEKLVKGQLVLTSYVGLTVKPAGERGGKMRKAWTNDDIGKQITRLIRATGLGGKGIKPREIINNPTVLNGQVALVKVALRQETAEFPEGNQITGFRVES